MNEITWTKQDSLFGLNHSSRLGVYKDFVFDIRYDYDGNPWEKPTTDCGLWLTVYFLGSKVKSVSGGLESVLVEASEKFLSDFFIKYGKK